MKKFYLFPAILASVFLFQSCVNEEDFDFNRIAQTTINPTIGAPLLDTEIKMTDFFDFDSLIAQNEGLELATRLGEDGGSYLELSFFMEDTFNVEGYVQQIEQAQNVEVAFPTIEVPNISELVDMGVDISGLTLSIPDFAGGELADVSIQMEQLDDGVSLDSLILRSGGVSVLSNTDLLFDVDLVLSSSSIRNNETGEFYRDTIPIASPNGELNVPFIDLSNSTILLKDSVGVSESQFLDLRYGIIIHCGSNESSVGGNHNLDLVFSLSSFSIEIAYGRVGKCVVPIRDSIDLDILQDAELNRYVSEGGVDFERLSFEVTAKTPIGVGCVIQPKVYSETQDGVITQFFAQTDSVRLQRALLPGEIGVSDAILLETDAAAIEIIPRKIVYNLDAHFSDYYSEVSYPSFVQPHNAYLYLSTRTTMPVTAKLTDLHYEKDVEFMDFLQDIDYLNSAKLKLVVENELPAETEFDFVMLDSTGAVIDVLFDKPISMQGAPVDANGNVLAPLAQTIEVSMTADKYKLLQKASKIKMSVKLNTSSASSGERPYVRFKKEAAIRIKASVKAETNITF